MKKIILSLLLVFTLIPIVPSNTASAGNAGSAKIYIYNNYQPIELAPAAKEKKIATCVTNGIDSFNLLAPIVDPSLVDNNRPPYQLGMKYESGEYSEPFSVSGGAEDVWHENLEFSFPLGGKKGKESFYIQKDYIYPLTVPYPICLRFYYDDSDKYCYNCTFLDGSNEYWGKIDCGPVEQPSTPDTPSAPDTPNGASRILAPLSALFGALLLLF